MARSVDLEECPTAVIQWGRLQCRCKPLCAICGFPKHSATHAPALGDEAPDAPAWGHEYVAQEVKR